MAVKITEEMANAELDRWADAMGLKLNVDKGTDEDKAGLATQKGHVIDALMSGDMHVQDDGLAVYTPTKGDAKPIKFYEPTGATLAAMDTKKKGQDVGKTYAAMADMTRTSAGMFSKMPLRDLRPCMAIFTLFMG